MSKIYLKFHLFLLLLLIFPYTAMGITYYIDGISGSDKNNGTSPNRAWKTIEKVNSSMGKFKPGDFMLFKRGATFSGNNLEITVGGEVNNPLTFGAYGDGNRPIFYSMGIQCKSSNIKYIMIQDLHIKDLPKGQGIAFYGVTSHITISRCYLENMPNGGIFIQKCHTYLIEDCEVHDCYNSCITIYGSATNKITNGIVRNNICSGALTNDGINIHKDADKNEAGPYHLFENNICYECYENGIDITSGSYITLIGNETFSNGQSGILLGSPPHTRVERHYSHDELTNGIHIGGSVDLEIKNSIIFNAHYNTLDITPSTSCSNVRIFNNTFIYGPNSTGRFVNINNGASDLTFKNNIFASTQYDRPATFIRFTGDATVTSSNSHFDYNVWWRGDGESAERFYDTISGNYSFAYWRSYYGQGNHSRFIDPILKDLEEYDFNLSSESPCIDAGTEIGGTIDFNGTKIPQGMHPDIGALEYQVEIKKAKIKRNPLL